MFNTTAQVTGQNGPVAANSITALINDSATDSNIIASNWVDADPARARAFWGADTAALSLGVSTTGPVRLSVVTGLVSGAPANSFASGVIGAAADIRLRAANNLNTEVEAVQGSYDGNGGTSFENVIIQIADAVTQNFNYNGQDIPFAGGSDSGFAPGFVLRLDMDNKSVGGNQQQLLQMALLSLGHVETSSLTFNLAETFPDSVTLVGSQTVNGAVANLDYKLYQRKGADSSSQVDQWVTFLSGQNKSMGEINAAMVGLPQRVWDGPCLLYTSPSPRDKRQSRMPSSA